MVSLFDATPRLVVHRMDLTGSVILVHFAGILTSLQLSESESESHNQSNTTTHDERCSFTQNILPADTDLWSRENTLHKIHVVWNNCFRHTFRCCWRESVRPLQYFCKSLPLSYLIDQTKLPFWKKMYISNNIILYSLSRFVLNRFMSVDSQYSVVSPAQPVDMIKSAVWSSFPKTLSY